MQTLCISLEYSSECTSHGHCTWTMFVQPYTAWMFSTSGIILYTLQIVCHFNLKILFNGQDYHSLCNKGKPLLTQFLLRRIRFNTNYNLQPCPTITWLNFDLTRFFKIKCVPKRRPTSIKHMSYSIVCELVRCSNNRQNCGSPFGARKVFIYSSCISTGSVQTCVCCALLISLPSTTRQHRDKMSANKKINDGTEGTSDCYT